MLYHTLLSSLAAGDTPLSALAARHELNTHAQFSPAFVSQVAALADEVFYDAPSSAEEVARAPDPAGSELARNDTVEKLWGVMMKLFTEVVGEGGMGRVLRAEYRSRGTGGVIGEQVFAMDEGVLGAYVGHRMGWWRGERAPEGVAIQEALNLRPHCGTRRTVNTKSCIGVKEICGVAAAIAAATAFLELHRHRRCREQRRRRATSDSLALPKRAFRGRYEYARFDFDLAIFGDGRHGAVRHHFRFTQEEIRRLAPLHRLHAVPWRYRNTLDAETALCVVTERLAFLGRWEACMALFGKSARWLSAVFNDAVTFLVEEFTPLL
ncbi:hypothetical protein VE00_10109 [Pseudogymnoascus sp. WSF 3629]|nr:hypothetical protein VE00_10109 [Pseudogymnoascus sp. WSF 3629]